MNTFSWQRFLAVPLVGILRGFGPEFLPGIVHASIAGGLTSIEVTMNSPDATAQIRAAAKLANGQLNIGAGTVLNPALLEAALAAGASFIVTPSLHEEVVRLCVERAVPIFPGVFSPTETIRASALGVSWVKLFPADVLGTAYLRAIKASFPHLKLIPTGGVSLETLTGLLAAGADGFGIGGPLFAPERIRAGDWAWLEVRVRDFVQLYQRSRNHAE